MPTRDTPRQSDPAFRLRDLLTPRVAGVTLALGAVSVRAGAVPLFRWRDTERTALDQIVRVSVDGPAGTSVRVALTRDGDGIAAATVTPDASGTPALLAVPEVDRPTDHALTVSAGGESASATLTVTPQRRMEIHLVQHSHLDIGYTDPQAMVLEAQLAYLDQAVALAHATADWPEHARFRWVVEVTLPLRRWMAVRPRAQREAFLAAVRSGQIEVSALAMNMHTEAFSIDELGRQLAFADDLRERHGVEIVSATQSDVPGATVGLVSLLADAGVRYLAVAHNYAGRSVPHLVGGQALARPFWWRAPDGDRVLTWFTDSPNGNYVEGNQLGFTTDAATVLGNLPEYLAALTQFPFPLGPFPGDDSVTRPTEAGYDFAAWTGTGQPFAITRPPYPHDILHLRVQGAHSDNAHPSLRPAEIARDWAGTWAWPRIRTSTNRDFFEATERRLGDRIPTHEGDWTDWWADGLGSAARELGVNRRAQAELRTAQTLHSIASALADPDDRPDILPEVDATYDDLAIFDEHTWGASNPWHDGLDGTDSGALQWGWKASHAHRAGERAGALLGAAAFRLAGLAAPSSGGAGFAVVNPSGFARTDLVRLLIPAAIAPVGAALAVTDEATGAPVPVVAEDEPRPLARAAGVWLTLLARDVPAVGYRRYRLAVDADAPAIAPPPVIDPDLAPLVLESPAMRLRIDAAGAYIADLTLADGRSLVDPEAPFGFNEFIHERYTTAPGFNHHSNFTTADGNRLLGARSTGHDAVVIARSRTALWDRVTIRARGEGLDWLETTVTLPLHSARVDILNRLSKPATTAKESLFFAFPFAAPDDADLRYEITGGTVGERDPAVPGAAHYVRALRHGVTITADGQPPVAWATREAPLVQPHGLVIPYAPFPSSLSPERVRPGTLYSWVANNLWDTNFPDRQGGEMTFAYRIATDPDRPVAELGRDTAAGSSQPLVGIPSSPLVPGAGLPPTGSFLGIDHPEVTITHLAPSRRGHGLVAFIESAAREAVTVPVTSDRLTIRRAWLGTFLERDLVDVPIVDGAVTITVPAGAFVSLSLDAEPVA